MNDATWAALTATLTLLGAIWTFYAFRNRGAASGVRGAAFTLLPIAAYTTGTLEMFTEIGQSVGDWATHLVFSPVVWAGVVLTGLSVVLFMVSGAMRDRGIGGKPGAPAVPRAERTGALGKPTRAEPAVMDDDLADIEAILRKRGIS